MALTAYGKNAAVAGATAKMKFVGLYGYKTSSGLSSVQGKITTEWKTTETKIQLSTSEAKGFVVNAIVVFRGLTAGSNIVAGRPYYIRAASTNEFEISREEGGPAIALSGANQKTTECEVCVLVEQSVARVATSAWGTPALGEVSEAGETIKMPAGFTATDAFWHEKASAGTNKEVMAVAKLETEVTFATEYEYKVTTDKLEGTAVA